jgi:hypothetical protein
MTPQSGAHSTRLQQHILALSATSIRAITNSTELCPELWHNIMNAGVCNIHSINCLLSKCFLCFYGCAIHTLPILWNVTFLTCITMEFHCTARWYVFGFTCFFSKCCLQCASVLQAGISFQAINWLSIFYIPEQKGLLLVVSVIKHTFITTQNTKLLHILCMSHNY